MIRPARVDDIPALVELGRQMYLESPNFRHLPLDLAKGQRWFAHAIKDSNYCVIVAADDEPYGVLLGYCIDYWFADATTANDLLLYVRPDKRTGMVGTRLIRAFESGAAP